MLQLSPQLRGNETIKETKQSTEKQKKYSTQDNGFARALVVVAEKAINKQEYQSSILIVLFCAVDDAPTAIGEGDSEGARLGGFDVCASR